MVKGGIFGTGAGDMSALGFSGEAEINHPVTWSPVVSGNHGKAWLTDLEAARRAYGVAAGDDGTLASWVIEAPWAHPLWHSYWLGLVHLRPLQTPREILIYLDEATHEIWLHSIAPEADREAWLRGERVPGFFLTPCNFSAQIVEISDALAIERVRRAVQESCDGTLSPDVDFTHEWVKRFGDNMRRDRAGARPPKKVMR